VVVSAICEINVYSVTFVWSFPTLTTVDLGLKTDSLKPCSVTCRLFILLCLFSCFFSPSSWVCDAGQENVSLLWGVTVHSDGLLLT